MNDEILIGLGEVSEETKGCFGPKFENVIIADYHNDETPEDPC